VAPSSDVDTATNPARAAITASGAPSAPAPRQSTAAPWPSENRGQRRRVEHLAKTIALAQRHPKWRLSLQLHKILGVP
jgi:organic radical activating enzyme